MWRGSWGAAWARACAWCASYGLRNKRVPQCGGSTRCAPRADDADGRAETAMRGIVERSVLHGCHKEPCSMISVVG
eukprot:12798659-Heterocapsa_arctica.AAC.1